MTQQTHDALDQIADDYYDAVVSVGKEFAARQAGAATSHVDAYYVARAMRLRYEYLLLGGDVASLRPF